MFPTDGDYYLGRQVDPKSGQTGDKPLLYDPEDLTTHAVVVGMTGSGKTGLCIDLLEEAALNDVPALMIDPKGDITNLLLHFPELQPEDFAPWIDPTTAKRDGQTVEEAAVATAAMWRDGLAGWDIDGERIAQLDERVQFAIYTPGSTAGIPLSVLASLEAPAIPWAGNEEILREQINGTVTALLGLAGLEDIDPVQSREHILMANLFETAWSDGRDLTLADLIQQIQTPPFSKLGVLDINSFYPEKDRQGLALRLNSMLASPSFQSWIEGEPLDIQQLLFTPDGRPRHSIFYLAHLNDAERMFIVTLLFSAVETWMRTQRGSGSLRALVYFDEIFGYMPPGSKPPSKEPMLRMLKQARAFGVGMVLATQNPVDIDYKGLSNAGTWFIGKLGTEQDKNRLIDGLATIAGGTLDRKEYDRLISAIGKRVFLMRNVHEKQPLLFQTRWAMNYLAGPMTRAQIPELNALVGAEESIERPAETSKPAKQPKAKPAPKAAAETTAVVVEGTTTRPAAPSRVDVFILPANLSVAEAAEAAGVRIDSAEDAPIVYHPALLAQATARISNSRYGVDHLLERAALVGKADASGLMDWEPFFIAPVDERDLGETGVAGSRYATLEGTLADGAAIKELKSAFADWVYRQTELPVRAHTTLKVYGGPDVSDDEFEELVASAADREMREELDDLEAAFTKKIKALEEKIAREERELAEDMAELAGRKQEEWFKHAETLMGMFTKRRRSVSSSLTKRRMTAKAKADVEESEEAIAEYTEDLEELRAEMEEAMDEEEAKWQAITAEIETIPLRPTKTNTRVTHFGIAWVPYYVVESGDQIVELPAFAAEPAD